MCIILGTRCRQQDYYQNPEGWYLMFRSGKLFGKIFDNVEGRSSSPRERLWKTKY